MGPCSPVTGRRCDAAPKMGEHEDAPQTIGELVAEGGLAAGRSSRSVSSHGQLGEVAHVANESEHELFRVHTRPRACMLSSS